MKDVKKELKLQERSLAWLSRQIGVSETCVYKWSSGERKPSLAYRLAMASVLEKPLSALFNE